MGWIIFKYLVTAAIVVAVSEVAKRSDKLGALIVALPLVTILAMIWLYAFWYVVPTLPMFLIFPSLLHRFGFWPSLGLSALITCFLFGVFAFVVSKFGINLIP